MQQSHSESPLFNRLKITFPFHDNISYKYSIIKRFLSYKMTPSTLHIKSVNSDVHKIPQYRLGDAVLYRQHSAGQIVLNDILNNPDLFKSSILYKYGKSIDKQDKTPQWNVLRQITQSHTKQRDLKNPDDNELVIHLRLGDIKGFKESEESLVNRVFDDIQKSKTKINTVSIVTAIHFGKSVILNDLSPEDLQLKTDQEIQKATRIVHTSISMYSYSKSLFT